MDSPTDDMVTTNVFFHKHRPHKTGLPMHHTTAGVSKLECRQPCFWLDHSKEPWLVSSVRTILLGLSYSLLES